VATIITALAALQARAAAQITTMPLYWPDENIELPDEPIPFVYFFIDPMKAQIAGFGGGRGSNLWRNEAELQGFVFVPVGWGLVEAVTRAEAVAAAFRSYRDDNVSCFGAGVHPVGKGAEMIPPGLDSAAGNFACAVAIIDFHYDQIG
jgi:hypothetical protein